MAKKRKYGVRCNKCGTKWARCRSCGSLLSPISAFSRWQYDYLYSRDDFSPAISVCTDIDFVWLNHRDGWIITIEEKTHSQQKTGRGQALILSVLKQMLSKASNSYVFMGRKDGGWRRVEYRGHYHIVFSHEGPEDSSAIYINDVLCTKEDLVFLLKHGRLPHP